MNLDGTPRLARRRPPTPVGIVHLGPGAFFRAFHAIHTHEAMAAAGGDWGIAAVSLRSAAARDRLGPQQGVYTSIGLAPGGREYRVVDSIAEVLVAPESPEAVLARLVDPRVRVVTLTVTEKGYCHHPASGRLDRAHPDIVHDVAHPHAPRSAPGFLVEALARRRGAGVAPFTVVSCDNLSANGTLLRRVVVDVATARDAALADWIGREARFPSTMVDRITPATTEADIERLAAARGYVDLACVSHEPFRQWVVEDDFVGERPAWERAGARFVRSVEAHELMKLRCLNGTHSTLAYLGRLAGHDTVAEAVADPVFAGLCERLWREEIVPTVPPPEGEDLGAYCAALLERYANRAIRHRLGQIATDGSRKLPPRLLGTVRDNLDAGRLPSGLCLAVAGWMRHVGGRDERGDAIEVRDPLADRLRALCDASRGSAETVDALLGVDEVFAPELARDARFRDALVRAHERLVADGARACAARYVAGG